MDGQVVNDQNLSALVSWLRPQAARIDEWSTAFDTSIKAQLSLLPQVTSDDDIPALEAKITTSEYITALRDNLFSKINKDDRNKTNMGLIEFAYAIKTSEEAAHDCDDAEKFLTVVFDIFCDFCGYRLPLAKDPGRYAGVYTQQLGKFMETMRESVVANARKSFGEEGKTGNAEAKAEAIREWVNGAGVFRSISENNMFNADGSIRYETYKFQKKTAATKGKGKAEAAVADTADEE